VPKSPPNPYRNYDIDDWQWEFLKRNKRYQRAYKAIEWLRKRLDKQYPNKQLGSFSASGGYFHFTREYLGNGSIWRFDESSLRDEDKDGLGINWYLDLPSPTSSSIEYKAKILRMMRPRAVVKLGEWSDKDGQHLDIRPPFREQKLAILIDVRYETGRIVSELKKILKLPRPKTRNRLDLYEQYLAVWDRFQTKKTAEQIAAELYPEVYKTKGGNISGDKSSLSTMIYDHRDRAQELIDSAFPTRSRPRKIQK